MIKFKVRVRSKATFGVDTITIDVHDGQDVAEVAERGAASYGAQVLSIEPEDPLALARAALRECIGFVDAWQSHLSDIGKGAASKTVAAVVERARQAYQYSKPLDTEEKAIEKGDFYMGTITADFLPDGMMLTCYSNGDLHNGFGCPYFTREEAMKLCDVDLIEISYNKDGDFFQDNDPHAGEDTYEKTSIVVDGEPVTVFAVGAYSWCWDEVQLLVETATRKSQLAQQAFA
jgi:hypothetical protein